MNIYLPIAEMSVNLFVILGLGMAAGVLSGLFGVGGGFLLTPFLMFMGVPPTVAVATSANQIIASSVSGFASHWRQGNVDVKMGWYLLMGGIAGSSLGVGIFRWLKHIGYVDLIISLSYMVFLGVIGFVMARESLRHYRKQPPPRALTSHWTFIERLPWPVEFPRSKLRISAVLPLTIGVFVGILVSLMGIGGGFFLVPAMIYILGMPTAVVVGTSLFQIIFITAHVTLLHAITTQTVDIVLALLLLSGSVVGVQLGIKLAMKLPGEKLRGFLAALVLAIALKLAFDLFAIPADIYSVDFLDD